MFVIVEFKDRQMAVVPLHWLKDENTVCLWPKIIKNEEAYGKLVRNLISPKSNWTEYTVVKVHRILENYDEANSKLQKYIEESESESTDSHPIGFCRKVLSDINANSQENNSSEEDVQISDTGDTDKTLTNHSNKRKSVDSPKTKQAKFRKSANYTLDSGSSFEDETDVSTISKTHSDIYHELTPTISESSTNSKINIKPFEEQVISDLEILKSNQEQHTLVLSELLRTIRSHSLESLQKPLDLPNLPINSKHDYRAWEEFLQNAENVNYMTKRLAAVGGSTVRNSTMNIMKFIMTNKVAMYFNWSGRDKKPFKETKLMGVIYDAVKLAFVGRTNEDLSDKHIADAVKDWLKQGKHRYVTQKK